MNEAISFDKLSDSAMRLSAQVIVDTADLVFLLWPDGYIAEATLGAHAAIATKTDALKNCNITEIVHPEDAAKLVELVTRARNGQQPRPIKLRHSALIQEGTVARYSAHLAGDQKNIMLLACLDPAEMSLSAQAAHAEIARHHRDDQQIAEARYRLLFESSSEGLLIADQASGLIEQTNSNAEDILETPAHDLVGTALWSHFEDHRDSIDSGETPQDNLDLTVRTAKSDRKVRLRAKTARSRLGTMTIVQLNLVDASAPTANSTHVDMAISLLQRTSVPLLLTGQSGTVSWCNGALAALVSDTAIIGRPAAEVLGVSSHALDMALRQADLHGKAPTSLSALDSRLAISEDAQITIIAVPQGAVNGYGVIVHMIDDAPVEPTVPESSALADLVGKASLKTLVRKSTDVIERNCIEAALRLSDNNRAAAAAILGLSRQSLYLKMREHKLS